MTVRWTRMLATRRIALRVAFAVALFAAVGVVARAYYNGRDTDEPKVSLSQLSRGDIVSVVTTTGALQAVTTVQVGTQVSGTIAWLGADFNSVVHKGQVIARLDTSLIDAQLQQSRATLARNQADVENQQVQVADAQQKYDRARMLADRQLIAQSDLDAAKVAVDISEAQLKAVRAQVVQAQAALHQNEVNRENTVITAPIDGIVIERSVDVGQTVAASLSSPTIFAIAADLTDMQVRADVDESDIGKIQAGQPVTFTVDAYPRDRFAGKVSQVRLQPTVTQNVTTYTVIVDVSNPELKLKPGMTATANIEVARRDDVVRVPNAALHVTPPATGLGGLGLDTSQIDEGLVARNSRRDHVWVRDGDTLRALPLQLGLTDGQFTEVLSNDVPAGAEVVTNISTNAQPARAATTPFLPGNGMLMGPPVSGFRGTQSGAR